MNFLRAVLTGLLFLLPLATHADNAVSFDAEGLRLSEMVDGEHYELSLRFEALAAPMR